MIASNRNWSFDRERILRQTRAAVIAALYKAAVDTQNTLKGMLGSHGSGKFGPASPAGTPPGVRSGHLRTSIQIDRSDISTKLRVRVGPRVPYARIQEFGGTIIAKGKKLAIPIGEAGVRAQTRAGGNLRSLELYPLFRKGKPTLLCTRKRGYVAAKHGKRRSYFTKGGALRVAKPGSKRADTFIWQKGYVKKIWHYTPLFVLKDSVTLPPRPYMRPGLQKAKPLILARFKGILK